MTPERRASSLDKTVLNALSAHMAIWDHRGFILETNRAWQAYAGDNDMAADAEGTRLNYLEVCDRQILFNSLTSSLR